MKFPDRLYMLWHNSTCKYSGRVPLDQKVDSRELKDKVYGDFVVVPFKEWNSQIWLFNSKLDYNNFKQTYID